MVEEDGMDSRNPSHSFFELVLVVYTISVQFLELEMDIKHESLYLFQKGSLATHKSNRPA